MDVEKIEIAEHEFNILLYMKHDKIFFKKMCSSLEKAYFNKRLYGRVFEIIQKHSALYGEFPSNQTLCGFLSRTNEDEEEYSALVEAISEESNFNKLMVADRNYISDTAIAFAKRAKMKKALLESYDLLAEDKFNEIIAKLQDALKFNIDVNIGTDLFDVDTRYAKLEHSIIDRIPTGYDSLNAALGGTGWCRKELYCVLGPPGMGKSIFLPNFGRTAVFSGYNVVHYSLEMSEERVGLRYDGPVTGIDINQLPGQAEVVKAKYDRMISYPPLCIEREKVGRLIIKEFQTAAASVLDIEAHLEILKSYEDFIPDVIVVDYGDIMNAVHKSNNQYEEQGWVFRELRGLAQKYNCVVITATQARRDALGTNGGTKTTVGMDQTADSMEKNRILDGLFSIVQSTQEKLEGIINLYVAKNRNGPSGILLPFGISYGRMEIIDKMVAVKKSKEEADENEVDPYAEQLAKDKDNLISGKDLAKKFNTPDDEE